MKERKGQIWIETVLYTLIGLALIGLVLAFITPKINESKDRAVIEQSIGLLNLIDDKINIIISGAPGNTRNIDITLKKGDLYFNSTADKITIVLDDITEPLTQEGTDVDIGRIKARSSKTQKANNITLTLDYSDTADIGYFEGSSITPVPNKKFTISSTPYKFSFANKGSANQGDKPVVEIKEISGV